MRRALLALCLVLGLAAGALVSGAAGRGLDTTTGTTTGPVTDPLSPTTTQTTTLTPTVHVVSVINYDGQIAVKLSCAKGVACRGTLLFPQLGVDTTAFALAAGQVKTVKSFAPGPDHAKLRQLKTLEIALTEQLAAGPVRSDRSYSLGQKPFDGGGSGGGGGAGGPGGAPGPISNNGNGPNISKGPATRSQSVKDRRGDAHSSFQLPVLFDITQASAKRVGASVVLTVTTVQAIGTLHDGFGNPSAPCVEIPWAGPQYPMFLFGNGQLSGYRQHYWPKMKVHISGNKISWTVPKRFLFTKGFRWRAAGGCDAHHLADLAPDQGYETFRWVTVK